MQCSCLQSSTLFWGDLISRTSFCLTSGHLFTIILKFITKCKGESSPSFIFPLCKSSKVPGSPENWGPGRRPQISFSLWHIPNPVTVVPNFLDHLSHLWIYCHPLISKLLKSPVLRCSAVLSCFPALELLIINKIIAQIFEKLKKNCIRSLVVLGRIFFFVRLC